ncbi:MAG: peptidoglycan editing factor PgeF [Bacillota bacterium]
MDKLITKNNIQYLENQALNDLGFKIIFTTRNGGFSNPPYDELNLGFQTDDEKSKVLKNRKKLFESLGYNPKNIIFSEQVHSDKIKEVDASYKKKGVFSYESSISNIDGMVSTDKSIILGGLFADCVPIYIVDKNKGYFSLIHSGWKGTFGNIITITIDYFINKLKSKTDDLVIIIGPAISKDVYEIDENLANKFKEKFDFEKPYLTKNNNNFYLDLKELNRLLALKSGIYNKNIYVTKYCTYKDEKLFYSYRRDEGKTGRMAALITRN